MADRLKRDLQEGAWVPLRRRRRGEGEAAGAVSLQHLQSVVARIPDRAALGDQNVVRGSRGAEVRDAVEGEGSDECRRGIVQLAVDRRVRRRAQMALSV